MTLQLTLDSNTEFLRAIDLWQTPISALLPFWEGEQAEFATFCKAHRQKNIHLLRVLYHKTPIFQQTFPQNPQTT